MCFLQVTEGAWLQEIEQGDPAAGKHDQIGFHVAAKHFHAIGIFAGLFFIDCPFDGATGLIKFVAFENHLVVTVFFIGQSPQVKFAHVIDNRIIPGRSLIAKQYGPRCRLVGKQLAVPQKFGLPVDFTDTIAGQNPFMDPGRLRQMLN